MYIRDLNSLHRFNYCIFLTGADTDTEWRTRSVSASSWGEIFSWGKITYPVIIALVDARVTGWTPTTRATLPHRLPWRHASEDWSVSSRDGPPPNGWTRMPDEYDEGSRWGLAVYTDWGPDESDSPDWVTTGRGRWRDVQKLRPAVDQAERIAGAGRLAATGTGRPWRSGLVHPMAWVELA